MTVFSSRMARVSSRRWKGERLAPGAGASPGASVPAPPTTRPQWPGSGSVAGVLLSIHLAQTPPSFAATTPARPAKAGSASSASSCSHCAGFIHSRMASGMSRPPVSLRPPPTRKKPHSGAAMPPAFLHTSEAMAKE